MKRKLMINGVGVIAGLMVLAMPIVSSATTQLVQLPGDWLDMIATSSVPLLNALWTPILFMAGISIVGLIIAWVRPK